MTQKSIPRIVKAHMWEQIQTRWDSFTQLIGRQNEALLTMFGLHTVRQNRARRRNQTDDSTPALALALAVGLLLLLYLRRCTPSAPQHGAVSYRPPPPIVSKATQGPPGVSLYQYREPMPEVISHTPQLQTETRLTLQALTSGTFQMGPREPGAWRVCASPNPGNDTDFVTADVVPGMDMSSRWRLLGSGEQGVYFLQSVANAWYLSAHTWYKEGEERVRVQPAPKGDERVAIDGTPDSFRVVSRRWGNPRYLTINPAGSHFVFSAEGTTIFRAFR